MDNREYLPHVRVTLAAVRAMRAQDAVSLRAAADRMPYRAALMAAWVAIDALVRAMAQERGTSWDEEADRVPRMLTP